MKGLPTCVTRDSVYGIVGRQEVGIFRVFFLSSRGLLFVVMDNKVRLADGGIVTFLKAMMGFLVVSGVGSILSEEEGVHGLNRIFLSKKIYGRKEEMTKSLSALLLLGQAIV